MAKYDDDVCKRLLDIANRHNDCLNDYDKIVTVCPKRLMSRGIDLYGMFWPDMEISKYIKYKGRLTKNEKSRHYSYYFDEQDRLRLTERFNDDGTILDYIFYYYYENSVEIVWYSFSEKDVDITGFIDYKDGKISRFVESYNLSLVLRDNKNVESYNEYVFDREPDFVIHRVYATDMFSDGRIWETQSKYRKH